MGHTSGLHRSPGWRGRRTPERTSRQEPKPTFLFDPSRSDSTQSQPDYRDSDSPDRDKESIHDYYYEYSG